MRLKPTDGLDAAAFLSRNPPAHLHIVLTYRCPRCGNRVELHIPTSAVICTRCQTRMRPVT